MFWIALLILLVFIAFLLVRESKRRAEWQLEYRYLSRHEAHSENKTAATKPSDPLLGRKSVAETSRFEAEEEVSETITTNVMGRNKRPVSVFAESQEPFVEAPQIIATLSQQAAKKSGTQTDIPVEKNERANTNANSVDDELTTAVDTHLSPSSFRQKWQQVRAQVSEMTPKVSKRGEILAAIQQKTKDVMNTVLEEKPDSKASAHTQSEEQVSSLDLLPKWQTETQTIEAQQGYALMGEEVDEREWEEDDSTPNWDDDEQLPQEITLAEIEHRRERLRPLRKQETQLQADTEEIATASDAVNVKTIELDDVAHVIRAIKEEQQPMAIQGKVINEDDVAHVIQAIKSEAIGQVDDEHGPLEVIELPEPVKREQPAEHLEVIELNWAPRQSEYARRAGIHANKESVNTAADKVVAGKFSGITLERPELETIQLETGNYVPRTLLGREEIGKTELEVIELPSVASKLVTPKVKPTRQTIVLTDNGLETVNEFGEVVETVPAPVSRASDDDALLKAMVSKPNQERLIEDEDIRANLLRQRMARRRHGSTATAEPDAETDVIAEDEVLANLAKTDSPINRTMRPIKPRVVVRDSVIPPTARIGSEHGFKVKPESLPPAQPISTRFTPFQHPELVSASALGQAQTLDTTVVSVVATGLQAALNAQASVPPQAIPETAMALQTEQDLPWAPESEVENLFTNNVYSSRGWAQPISLEAELPVFPEVENDFEFFDMDAPLPEQSQPIVNNGAPATQNSSASVASTPVAMPSGTEMPSIIPTVAPQRLASLDASSVVLPNVQLLQAPVDDANLRPDDELLINNGIIIEEKLAEFKVNVSVTDAYAGPVITRYEIEPATGVRGSQVVNLEKDLARSLGFASIRVVETIPGKTCMGLELPNPKRQMIRLSSVFQAPVFQESKSKLTMALGQDISGNPVVTDLAKAPHLLVAGTTGSGKSVGVNAMILSMLFKATPEEVRMIMIDPKMLELSIYEGIPHLLAPVVTDMKLAANALNWCVNEMEKRYRLMSHMGVRNLAGYNQKIADAKARGQTIVNPFSITPDEPDLLEKLPFIVVVVDEFADLMMTAGKKIEELIARLAQKARAAGIHLILATQRPSVDVITGLIKANIPTRIAFQVSSKIDSRTILDQMGAENLLGQGDMLFLPPGTGYPRRIHGAFVADDEVHNVVEYLKQFGEPDYVDEILSHGGLDDSSSGAGGNGGGEEDPLYDQAVKFVVSSGKTSISAVQRQMRIGYNRAARLVDQMEVAGVLSAPEHNGNRSLLVPQREM